jgi:hypothetical protein
LKGWCISTRLLGITLRIIQDRHTIDEQRIERILEIIVIGDATNAIESGNASCMYVVPMLWRLAFAGSELKRHGSYHSRIAKLYIPSYDKVCMASILQNGGAAEIRA